MRKFIKVLLIAVIMAMLASCSPKMDDQVVVNVPTEYEQQSEYYWNYYSYGDEVFFYDDILQYSNDTLDFEFFLLTRDWSMYEYAYSEYDYSYTFNIAVSQPTTLTFSCNEDIFNIDFDPETTLNYIRTIPLDAFMDTCTSSTDVNIQIIEDGTTVYEDTFTYEINKDIDTTSLSSYTGTLYDYTNFLYIFLIGVTLLFGLVMGYRLYYNNRINKNFLDQDKKTFYLADIWVVFVLSTVVIIILIFSAIYISRERYQSTHYEQVYTTATGYFTLDIVGADYSVSELSVYVNGSNEITNFSAEDMPIELKTYTFTDQAFATELESIIDDFDGREVCDDYEGYYCYKYLDNTSFTLTVSNGDEYYMVHFLLDSSGEEVEDITLTDMYGHVYLISNEERFSEECSAILEDVNTLLSE